MIPDLGKYAAAVIGSFAASILLIAALILWSVWQSGRVKRALREAEARMEKAE